jgi:hypothetical protein
MPLSQSSSSAGLNIKHTSSFDLISTLNPPLLLSNPPSTFLFHFFSFTPPLTLSFPPLYYFHRPSLWLHRALSFLHAASFARVILQLDADVMPCRLGNFTER